MNNLEKVFLIDGMALIYRSYYAMIRNPLVSSSGQPTSSIYGFIRSLLKLIKNENPKYISIILDTKAKTFRHKMYSEYKATRKPMPDDLSEQIPILYEIFDLLNISVYKKDGFEADDLIGTISNHFRKKNINTYIYSSDKDLMQLVCDNVFVYSPGNSFVKEKLYNSNEVSSKWGVAPNQIIDYLSLVGDASDNIPGVKGVGSKTAVKLIDKYNNIDEIYSSVNSLDNERMKNKLIDSKKNAYLSKKLVTIDLDVNIAFKLSDMDVDKLKFQNILSKLHDLDIYTFDKDINKKNIEHNTQTTNKKYETINNLFELDSLISNINNYDLLSIDLETTDIDAIKAEIVGISLCFKPNEAYYIPIECPDVSTDLNLENVFDKLRPLLESGKIKLIGQNIKYDALIFRRFGINLKNIYFDTMIAESLISPEKNTYKLDVLSLDYLNYKMIPIEQLIGEKQNQILMNEVAIKDISYYACEDADVVLQIYQLQSKKIKELNIEKLFYEIEIPLISVLVEIEYNGVFIDEKLINDLSKNLKIKIKELSSKIYNISGKEFNLNSPKQLSEVLFDELQLKQIKKRSTAVEVLEKLKDYHPIISIILEYRHINKLVNTYLDTLPNFINSLTNRVHTSFNQAIASTGRLSSNKPNFQNIPIKTDMGRQIRKAIKAQDNNSVILSFDYSQIELRILAHYSNENNLIDAFQKNIDIHTRTAALIYGLSKEEVSENHRRVAKIINYSIVYGAGPYRISQELNISMKEASNIISNYFMRYPGIKEYIEHTIDTGFKDEYVSTYFGRRRNTINLRSSNRNISEAEKRAAINMPIQGTASELIKVAMNNIYKKMKKNEMPGKMILQVHDELVFEVPKTDVENLIEIVVHEMENSMKFKVPIRVDYNYGENWYEAH